MTITSDYADGPGKHAPAQVAAGVGRMLRCLVGLALVMAALGLWIALGASWSGELLILKLGVSFFFALCGLTLIGAQQAPPPAD
jgi:hypothetical protein